VGGGWTYVYRKHSLVPVRWCLHLVLLLIGYDLVINFIRCVCIRQHCQLAQQAKGLEHRAFFVTPPPTAKMYVPACHLASVLSLRRSTLSLSPVLVRPKRGDPALALAVPDLDKIRVFLVNSRTILFERYSILISTLGVLLFIVSIYKLRFTSFAMRAMQGIARPASLGRPEGG
jgi:hypothetical protein